MESRVPVPTDNIYKFYALFGLLLVLFSFGAALYQTRSTNEAIFGGAIQVAELEAVAVRNASQEAHLKVAEKRLQVAVSNSKFYFWAMPVLAMIGTGMMLFGFGAWHKKVQPVQDETANLQLEKLRLEVERLRAEGVAQAAATPS